MPPAPQVWGSSDYELWKLSVIEEIIAAFDNVSREDGVTLHEATVIDDYGTATQRAKARTKDTESRWQDVPAEDIRTTDAVLSFLDPKGFCYYLPAYLVWHLRNIDNDDPEFWSNTFESIIFHLKIDMDYNIDSFRLERFHLFSTEQSRAIAKFLLFVAEHEDILLLGDNEYIVRDVPRVTTSISETLEIIDKSLDEARKEVVTSGFPDNDARVALKQYWGQFL